MSRTSERAIHAEQTVQLNTRAGSWKFVKMLCSMLKIGIIGFGGGSALIPVIEDEVVRNQKILSKSEYDEDVIAACVTPGALPVEIAAGSGLRTFGLPGMVFASAAMAAPGAILTVLLLTVFSGASAESLNAVRFLSIGLGAFISSLLISYAVRTQETFAKHGRRAAASSLLIIIAVFLLTCGKNLYGIIGIAGEPVLALSTVQVLALAFFVIFYTGCRFSAKNTFAAAAFSVLYLLVTGRSGAGIPGFLHIALYLLMAALAIRGIAGSMARDRAASGRSESIKVDWKAPIRQTAVWLAVMAVTALPAVIWIRGSLLLVLKGFLSSLISFGGGDAYLSVADGMFVGDGLVKTADFYGTLVPIANVLPGSILCKILTGVGYFTGLDVTGSAAGGWIAAGACLGVSVGASGLVFCWIRWLLSEFQEVTVFKEISRWIRPIISGLLLNVMLTMIRTNIDTGAALGEKAAVIFLISGALIAANLFFMRKKRVGNGLLIAGSAAAGALLLAL